jgi:hypothetical protein
MLHARVAVMIEALSECRYAATMNTTRDMHSQ